MTKTRIDVEFELETLSYLYIGSGLANSREGELGEVQGVQKTIDGKAWIPGSTLKGALRRLARNNADDLYGTSRTDDGSGYGAFHILGAESTEGECFDVFTHNAIDRGRRTAEFDKLFKSEYVKINTVFRVKLVGILRKSDQVKNAIETLAKTLSAFHSANGVSIGANKSDSFGRLKLREPKLSVQTQKFSATGWEGVEKHEVPIELHKGSEANIQFTLICPGPYFCFGENIDNGESSNIRRTLERDGKPVLLETSLSGVLRSRAEWILANMNEFSTQMVKTSTGKEELNIIERLFGTTGRRGSLNIRIDDFSTKQQESKRTRTAIDRFSGGALNGQLFAEEFFTDLSLSFSIELFRELKEDEKKFLEILTKDIETNGLKLGGLTGIGYGWFEGTNKSLEMEPSGFIEPELHKPEDQKQECLDEIMKNPADNSDIQLTIQKYKRFAGVTLTEEEVQNALKLAHAKPASGFSGYTSLAIKEMYPNKEITFPYRIAKINPDMAGMPEPAIAQAATQGSLHSKPVDGSLSGFLDVNYEFFTPILVSSGGNEAHNSKINDEFVIPGSSLRGCFRSTLEVLTNARLTRMSKALTTEDKNGELSNKKNTPPTKTEKAYLSSSYEQWRESARDKNLSEFNERYEPDFVEAIFGFAHEPSNGEAVTKELHERLHLGGRVQFSYATLEGKATTTERILAFKSPQLSADKIYNQESVGVKLYPARDPSKAAAKLKNESQTQLNDQTITCHHIDAAVNNPAIFRGRIEFHNLQPTELGALIYVLTWGGNEDLRHKLGLGKNLDCGQFSVNIGQAVRFGFDESGGALSPLNQENCVKAFEAYLATNKLDTSLAFLERHAAADPDFGEKIVGGGKWPTNDKVKGWHESFLNGDRIAAVLIDRS